MGNFVCSNYGVGNVS